MYALVEYMQQKTLFHGMRIPGAFSLIGNKAGLREYKLLRQSFSSKLTDKNLFVGGLDRIEKTSYARVGLMGNPSDGYFGKTLGLSVRNFWATVTLTASKTLRLIPNPLYDPNEFGSLNGLHEIGRREGYQGGMRLPWRRKRNC